MQRLKSVIAKLERQRDDLGKVIVMLREIEASGALEFSRDLSLDELEKSLVSTALARSQGSQSEAARMLGIGRDRLRYKMAKYKMNSDR